MKEMNDIENLFATNFGGESVAPPAEVKTNIDKAIFGKKKVGIIRLWPILLLLLIGTTTGVYFLSTGDSNKVQKQISQESSASKNSNNQVDSMNDSGNKISSQNQTEKNDENAEDELYEEERGKGSSIYSAVNENNSTNSKSNQKIDENGNFSNSNSLGNANHLADNNNGLNAVGNEKDGMESANNENQNDRNNRMNPNNLSDTDDNLLNPEHVNENRGMDITSNLELNTANTIELPLKDLAERAYAPKMEDNSRNLMSLRLYAGMANGVGPVNYTVDTLMAQTTQVSESNGLNLGVEWGMQFNSRFGISAGMEYFGNSSEVIQSNTVTVQDTVVINEYWEYVYNNPVTQDSIIDSNYVYIYAEYDVINTEASIVNTKAFSVPVFFSFTQKIGRSFDLSVYGGAKFSFLQQRFLDENGAIMNPDLRSFSMSLMLRPELTYNWNKFGVGVYGKVGYDVVNGMQWSAMRRNRYDVGAGIVLKYTF